MSYKVSLFNVLAFFMLLLTITLGFILEGDTIGFLTLGLLLFLTFTIFILDGILQSIFKNREIIFCIEFTLSITIIAIFLIFKNKIPWL